MPQPSEMKQDADELESRERGQWRLGAVRSDHISTPVSLGH